MNKSSAIIALILFVVAAIALFVKFPQSFGMPASAQPGVFESDHIGLKFSYPGNYNLTTRHDGYQGAEIHVLVLIDKDLASSTFEASEGPPTISILEIPLASSTELEPWIQNNSISNFYLSSDKNLVPISLGGEAALAYTYSGLYENDAVAIMHNGKMFLFFASWLTQDDQLRKDFQSILETVEFI